MHFFNFLATVLAASAVSAHPGADIEAEILETREQISQLEHRNLDHCTEILKRDGVFQRGIERRMATFERLRAERYLNGLAPRADPINTSHKSNKPYTLNTLASTIFASNTSCLLSPEVTEGPYYVTGEYIRSDLVENQPGVKLHLDILVLDTTTCKPVPNVFVEIWQTNSTGVYSGVVANGNGNFADKTNNKKSWLRGAQKTSADGVVEFGTIFPGHYTGRTTHIHTLVHTNAAAAQNNGTLIDTGASHVGQFFFDQSLITIVERTSPYTSNKQTLTTNAQDGILKEQSKVGDPFINYVFLAGGDSVSAGLLGWISFGINPKLSKTVKAATKFTGN
ncbi:Intradiol ring-cleavage dioxygenase [Podospora fimiseda]|uniref:Intradiol ring-cleavage dioxygenase n=1 Tax=Podospora fimiseda TaxID=252190 RepID=A0AAN6YMD6_9PEZI|nr:Intradiol ring-cleavage dioxygenase [Podospora fimiseda]